MKSNKTVLIIDAMNLLHRAWYVHKHLANSKGVSTGGVYGFMSMLMNYSKRFNTTNIIIAWESENRENWRDQYLPSYKENRKEDSDKKSWVDTQERLLQQILLFSGITQVRKKSFEADDIMAHFVTILKKNIKIVTMDKDLLQLINDKNKVRVLVPDSRKGDKLFCEKDVVEKYGFEPKFLSLFLAIQGDKVDNIPGIEGYGKVKATKLIQEHGSNIINSKFYKDHHDDIVLNNFLTHLIGLDCWLSVEEPMYGYKGIRGNEKILKSVLNHLEFKKIKASDLIKLDNVKFKQRLILKIGRHYKRTFKDGIMNAKTPEDIVKIVSD